MKKPELKTKTGAETCDNKQMSDWYVCFHYFGQGWEKIVDLSHICGKLYVCMHGFCVATIHAAQIISTLT